MNVLRSVLFLCALFLQSSIQHSVRWHPKAQDQPIQYEQPTPQEVMVDIINYLGLSLLEVHNENNNNNIAISPYGAVSVLVAIGEGLKGSAGYEIQQALNLPDDISVIRVGLRDIHRHLKSYFIPKEGFLAGLTLNKDNVTLNNKYEDVLKFYGYDIESFNNALYSDPITTTLISITRTSDIDVIKTTHPSTDSNCDNKTAKDDNTPQEVTTVIYSTTDRPYTTENDLKTTTLVDNERTTRLLETTTQFVDFTTTLSSQKRTEDSQEQTDNTITTEEMKTTTLQPTKTTTLKLENSAENVSEISQEPSTETDLTTTDDNSITTTQEINNDNAKMRVIPLEEEAEIIQNNSEIENKTPKPTAPLISLSSTKQDVNNILKNVEITTYSPVSVATKKSKITKRTTKITDEMYMYSTEPMVSYTEKPVISTSLPPVDTKVNAEISTYRPRLTTYDISDTFNNMKITTSKPSTIPTENQKNENISTESMMAKSQEFQETSIESYEEYNTYEEVSEETIKKQKAYTTGASDNEATTQQQTTEDVYKTSLYNLITSYSVVKNTLDDALVTHDAKEDNNFISTPFYSTNDATTNQNVKLEVTTIPSIRKEVSISVSESNSFPTIQPTKSIEITTLPNKILSTIKEAIINVFSTTEVPQIRINTTNTTTTTNLSNASIELQNNNTNRILSLPLPTNSISLNDIANTNYNFSDLTTIKNINSNKIEANVLNTTTLPNNNKQLNNTKTLETTIEINSPIDKDNNTDNKNSIIIMDKFETTTTAMDITKQTTNEIDSNLSTVNIESVNNNNTWMNNETKVYETTSSKFFMTTYKTYDDSNLTPTATINVQDNNKTPFYETATKKVSEISTTYLPTPINSNSNNEDMTTTQKSSTLDDKNNFEVVTTKVLDDMQKMEKLVFKNIKNYDDITSVFDQKSPIIYATDKPKPFTTNNNTPINAQENLQSLPTISSSVYTKFPVGNNNKASLNLELQPPESSKLQAVKVVPENWPTPELNIELTPPQTTLASFRKNGLNINNWSNRTLLNSPAINIELSPPDALESKVIYDVTNEQNEIETATVELKSSTLDIEVQNNTNNNTFDNTLKRNINNQKQNEVININNLASTNDENTLKEAVPSILPLISTSIITEKDKVNAYIETNGASQISIKIENQFEKSPSVTVVNLNEDEDSGYESEPKVVINGVLKENESPFEGTTIKAVSADKDGVSYEVQGVPKFFLSDDVSKFTSKNASLEDVIKTGSEKTEVEPSRLSLYDGNLTKRSVTTSKSRSRRTRSIVDYIIARYYDDHLPNERAPQRYEPEKAFSFLVNGKHREANLNYMTYDSVLPFYFAPNLNALALSFPLDSPKYYLLLLLPVDDDGIDRLIRDVRRMGSLRRIISNLKATHVKAQIPSFMLKGYVVLTPSLQKLGIRKIFEPRQADFTPMTADSDTYVTNLEQAVTVTIRNYVDPENLRNYRNLHQHGPVEFKADHPFLYFVLDSDINVTLMAGKIINPLNSRIR